MVPEPSAGRIKPQYIYDNAWQQARARLSGMEAVFDPGMVQDLEGRGVGEGWQCLEVGAGGGSITEWLCQRVGRSGRVVAIDLDTRFVEALDQPNLEVRRMDLTSDELETEAFDLVCGRFVLEHVPGRDRALHRMVAALKPGGWLLLQEFDHVTMLPDPGVDMQSQDAWGEFVEAYRRLMDSRSADLDYGRRLFGLLSVEGLTEVAAQGRVMMDRGGSAPAKTANLGFAQARPALVGTGAIADQKMAVVLSLFENPSFTFMWPLVMAAWGRRR